MPLVTGKIVDVVWFVRLSTGVVVVVGGGVEVEVEVGGGGVTGGDVVVLGHLEKSVSVADVVMTGIVSVVDSVFVIVAPKLLIRMCSCRSRVI